MSHLETVLFVVAVASCVVSITYAFFRRGNKSVLVNYLPLISSAWSIIYTLIVPFDTYVRLDLCLLILLVIASWVTSYLSRKGS